MKNPEKILLAELFIGCVIGAFLIGYESHTTTTITINPYDVSSQNQISTNIKFDRAFIHGNLILTFCTVNNSLIENCDLRTCFIRNSILKGCYVRQCYLVNVTVKECILEQTRWINNTEVTS